MGRLAKNLQTPTLGRPTAIFLIANEILTICRNVTLIVHFLVHKIGLRSVEEAIAVHERFFPQDPLSDTAKAVVRDAIQSKR